MQGGIVSVLLLAATITIPIGGIPCEPGRSWWNAERAKCMNCTICDASKSFAVLRPCEIHQDTVCAHISELDIDWSWIPRSHNEPPGADDYPTLQRIVWRKNVKEKVYDKGRLEEVIDDGDYDDRVPRIKIESEYVYLNDGFTWDWQTSTLLLAAAACTVFFVVVGFYSIYHARQWRHLRNNIRTDIEGLPVKLNLILTAKEIINDREGSTPEYDNQYSNIQCSYLEKLLAQNNKLCKAGPGNVYIRTADK